MNHDIERSGSDPNGGRGGRIGLLGRPRGQDKSWTDAPAILLAAAHTLHNACSLQNRDLAPVYGKPYTGQTGKTSKEPLEALPSIHVRENLAGERAVAKGSRATSSLRPHPRSRTQVRRSPERVVIKHADALASEGQVALVVERLQLEDLEGGE